MGIMEIFELSQVSRRVLNLLKLSRIPVARSVNVLIGKMDSIFFYELGSSTKKDFAIDFVEKPQSITGQMKINNICIDVRSKYTVELETIDCENGRDFRNKDGQLATVVHYSKFLVFLVWNDRFPE
ncbi:hypothetical protein GCK72_000121 [Caenorhabditis remanei]|uniref:Uncharacterized protein n=1 Tax=Caenorhabditis remanei TaxID=31234 RepID=A0A6A5HLA3_CAERE|nr:hypothetical protein GCK72_000121 [Caenorhabditis remanei]KAF1768309.1 hypothetical protein GCK72_000121 [Caenorhabditis remanei]